MAIPSYDKFYDMILDFLDDGQIHSMSELKQAACNEFGLTEEEKEAQIPSGGQTVLGNRIGWALAYLKKAGLITAPKRGNYEITEAGRKVSSDRPDGLDDEYLSQFDSFKEFVKRNKSGKETGNQSLVNTVSDSTPEESMDKAWKQINDKLSDDLLEQVRTQKPRFFEKLVVQLIEAMGYGGKLENPGEVTKYSGDGGIDGIIRQDALGFDKIYIQAKRWGSDHVAGAPDIQQFAGALMGRGANKGLFITTSRFSKSAYKFVEKHMTAKIVLIDGKQLTDLMIRYNIGVSTEHTYLIKKIDSDYFDDPDE